MAMINPYLNFGNNTEEAFNFYKSVFGGEFATVMRNSDVPADAMPPDAPPSDPNGIIHISLPIGNGTVLMGSDTPEYFGGVVMGNNFSISISADSKQDADRLFNGLSAGGKITMPMGDTFWGSYFGMFTDKFGVNWMVGYDAPRQ
jgi:PhnB protein